MFTKNEMNLMTWIARNEMTPVNGAMPECADDTACYFWASEFAAEEGLSTAAARGVAGSLQKKGAAYFERDEGETICGLTEEGFAAWSEAQDDGNDETTDEENEMNYEETTVKALRAEAKARGIAKMSKANKATLVAALEADDAAAAQPTDGVFVTETVNRKGDTEFVIKLREAGEARLINWKPDAASAEKAARRTAEKRGVAFLG